jgi:hypothetical protein
MSKSKSKVEKQVEKIEESVLDISDCKCGEEIKKIAEIEEYITTAKDLVVVHDDEINAIKDSLKDLHTKVDRALNRLGIG